MKLFFYNLNNVDVAIFELIILKEIFTIAAWKSGEHKESKLN